MAQKYVSIQKGSDYVYTCANMLYHRVKTKGNVKYLKCPHKNCDSSAKLVDDQFLLGVRAISAPHNNVHFCFTTLVPSAFHSYWSRVFHPHL